MQRVSDPGFSKLDTKMDSNLLQEGFYNLEFFNPRDLLSISAPLLHLPLSRPPSPAPPSSN